MYVILVYDVSVEKVNKVCQYLRRFLNWVQNSVFEGELTQSELEIIKSKLSEMISEDDSVRIYILRDEQLVKKVILGKEKSEISQFI